MGFKCTLIIMASSRHRCNSWCAIHKVLDIDHWGWPNLNTIELDLYSIKSKLHITRTCNNSYITT